MVWHTIHTSQHREHNIYDTASHSFEMLNNNHNNNDYKNDNVVCCVLYVRVRFFTVEKLNEIEGHNNARHDAHHAFLCGLKSLTNITNRNAFTLIAREQYAFIRASFEMVFLPHLRISLGNHQIIGFVSNEGRIVNHGMCTI